MNHVTQGNEGGMYVCSGEGSHTFDPTLEVVRLDAIMAFLFGVVEGSTLVLANRHLCALNFKA